jgi:hypothetical protein
MTSDQDAKVVAEPQAQRVQEGKDSSHLVGGQGKGHPFLFPIKNSTLDLRMHSDSNSESILGSTYK